MFWIYSLTSLYISVRGSAALSNGDNVVQPISGTAVEIPDSYILRKKMGLVNGQEAVEARLLRLPGTVATSPFNALPADDGATMYIAEENPPEIRVRAVAVNGEAKIALLDIGDIKGRLMREQDTFSDGTGRVRQISGDGVVWAWNELEFRSPLSE